MELLNHYSFLATAVLFFSGATIWVIRSRPDRTGLLMLTSLALLLGIIWRVVRPAASVGADSLEDVTAQIGAGVPVLLEFQSPY